MTTDNIFKVFLNNSGLIWKVLLYKIFVGIFISGICLACCYPLFNHLYQCGFISNLGDFFVDNIYNFNVVNILEGIKGFLVDLWSILMANHTLLIFAILCVCLVVLLSSILNSAMQLALNECVYSFMGSYTRINFFGSFLSNFWKGLKLGLCKIFTSVLFEILIIAALISGLWLLGDNKTLNILTPFILVFGFVFLQSLKQSMFSMWIPNIVTHNKKIWSSFGQNFKIWAKNFGAIFGATFVFLLIVFALSYGLSVLTCGVALIIVIPAALVFFSAIYMVLFFNFTGLRYYVDKDKIIKPKKLEDMEKIKDMRKII